MPLPPDLELLARRAITIRDSASPLYRVLDILAEPHGEVNHALMRLQDVRDHHLRDALKHCAKLLRALHEMADAPEAEPVPSLAPNPRATLAPAATSASSPTPATPALKPASPKPELRPFENPDAIGAAPAAKLFTDGASKGNPGQAGIGAALIAESGPHAGKKIAQLSRPLGIATNNQAEYTALIEGLEMAQRMGVRQLSVFSDSELMVKQVKGEYKVKDPGIQLQMPIVRSLAKAFDKFSITWIPRAQNAEADALSTASIPSAKSPGARKPGASEDLLGSVDDNPDEGGTGWEDDKPPRGPRRPSTRASRK